MRETTNLSVDAIAIEAGSENTSFLAICSAGTGADRHSIACASAPEKGAGALSSSAGTIAYGQRDTSWANGAFHNVRLTSIRDVASDVSNAPGHEVAPLRPACAGGVSREGG